LSILRGESWFERWAESRLHALRHLATYGSGETRRNAGFEKGSLAVNQFGAERNFLPGGEVAEFCSNGVG